MARYVLQFGSVLCPRYAQASGELTDALDFAESFGDASKASAQARYWENTRGVWLSPVLVWLPREWFAA